MNRRLRQWHEAKLCEDLAAFAASRGFRLHWRQQAVDTAMTGAEELERERRPLPAYAPAGLVRT